MTASAPNLVLLGMPGAQAIEIGNTINTFAGVGTAQAGAKALTTNVGLLTTTGGATAFRIDTRWSLGNSVQVFNTSATAALVYPPVGGAIDGGSTDASVSIAQNEGRIFTRVSATSWRSGESVLAASSLSVSGNATIGGTLGVTGLTTTAGVNSSDNLTMTVASKGLVLKQGANGLCGTFVANGVTPVTISNTSVATTDGIIISLNTVGGTVGVQPHVATITAATGFTVVCTAADTSTYNYSIIKNAA